MSYGAVENTIVNFWDRLRAATTVDALRAILEEWRSLLSQNSKKIDSLKAALKEAEGRRDWRGVPDAATVKEIAAREDFAAEFRSAEVYVVARINDFILAAQVAAADSQAEIGTLVQRVSGSVGTLAEIVSEVAAVSNLSESAKIRIQQTLDRILTERNESLNKISSVLDSIAAGRQKLSSGVLSNNDAAAIAEVENTGPNWKKILTYGAVAGAAIYAIRKLAK